MIPYCGCVKDSRPNNSPCMKHDRGKHCDDRVLLNVIEEAITFCISLSGFFYLFIFFPGLLFLLLILRWQKISTTSNRVCLLFPSPGAPSAAECPRNNKGKDIKAHKQHTPGRKEKSRVCVCLRVCTSRYATSKDSYMSMQMSLCVCVCLCM